MEWIVAIIVGGIVGWLASILMRREGNILRYIIFGILGSLLGQWLFGDVLGIGTAQQAGDFSFWGVLWGTIGAILLIAIVDALWPRERESMMERREPGVAHEYREKKTTTRRRDDLDE